MRRKLQLIGYYKLNEFSLKSFDKAFPKGFSGESGDGKKMPSAFSMNNPSPPPKEAFLEKASAKNSSLLNVSFKEKFEVV